MQSLMPIGRPGDRRGFVHKKLLGGISRISGLLPIPGAGLVSGVTGFFAGRGRATVPRTQTARVSQFSEAEKDRGRGFKFAAVGGEGDDCIIPGMRRDPGTNKCSFFLGERRGPDGGFDFGEAVMGRYGAGIQPGSRVIDQAVCPRGTQLGDDGLCYNKSQISNKQRMWPAGRKPLLTGGDMRAISTAARAATRLKGATKRLQKMGMLAKPAARRRALPAPVHQRLLEAHVTK